MSRVVSSLLLAGALAVLAFATAPVDVEASGRGTARVAAQENPIEATEESIADGRRIYGRFCRSCHGQRADGRGMAAPPGSSPANLIDDEWDHGSTDAEIFAVIKDGVPPDYNMDAWEGRITEDDMWNVINFLRDLAAE